MPKISILLTSYNHAKYIREAIDSVLAQTFSDFELIIWDDASSDDSWDIIQSYSDKRIKAFRNEKNLLPHYGVNKTISEVARGEYFAMHHSDDVWAPDKLQKQVAYLDSHAQCGAVFTRTSTIGEDSLPLDDSKHFYSAIFDQPNRSRQEWLRHFFFRGNALCHPSMLIRKRCYEECGTYNDTLAQLPDFDMWVRLCFKYEIHVLEDRLTSFRVRAGEMNSSGSRPEVRIRDRSEFHHVLKQYFCIATFDELASIFPEAQPYFRADGYVPKFVMSMIALNAKALLWAKFLGIETLLDLFADASERAKIVRLYQFNYRDVIALTGKHDLFNQELLASQNQALTECGEIISRQAQQIAHLTQSLQVGAPAATTPQDTQTALQTNAGMMGQSCIEDLPADRSAYEKATGLIESGHNKEGMELLEVLAQKGTSCRDVYNDLAVMYFNEGDLARAVPYFEEGIALEGKTGSIARNFASMLLMSGDIKGALTVWGKILREQPHDPAILETIREVLSHINPIPPEMWQGLVSDLRGGGGIRLPEIKRSRRKVSREDDAAAKEIKVFQIYYDEPTKAKIDPDFVPLDNAENLRPDWCEYWPIRNVLLNQVFDEDTYIGFLSPKFFEKTGMRGNEVLEKVRVINDDAISFSPYFDLGAIHPNPFVQGEAHHPGLTGAMQKVLSLLQIDLDLNSLVCDQTTTIFSNYFVARYSFWKKWFEYAEKIFAVCEGPDCELKNILVGGTTYRKGTDYAMKVFVLERLVTIVMEELGIASRVGIDIAEAPLILPGSKGNLVAFLVCDALKGQYLNTGNPVYKDAFFKLRSGVITS
jgi:glycosyltransferase involved in cell wall biosynthesis